MATVIKAKDFGKSVGQIGHRIGEAGAKLEGDLNKILVAGGNQIRTTIIESMTSGRREQGPSGIKYKRGKTFHIASAPFEAPATDTGQLLRTILFGVSNNELEVGSAGGAPYAPLLEEGTKNMEPRPFLEPAVDKHQSNINAEIIRAGGDIIEKAFQIKIQKTAKPDLSI